jgi:hypothetical protein
MTLTPPTKQEIAKTIYDWFIVNKNPRSASSPSFGTCWYRGENPNQRCAVGCCLPDELYQKDFENKNFYGICGQSDFVRNYFSQSEVYHMLNQCQVWHDNHASFGNVGKLREIFKDYKIDISQMPLLQQD